MRVQTDRAEAEKVVVGGGGGPFEKTVEATCLRQLPHVEEIVEFGRCRQHLALDLVPESNGHGHQLGSNIYHLLLVDVWIKSTLYAWDELQSKPSQPRICSGLPWILCSRAMVKGLRSANTSTAFNYVYIDATLHL